MRFAVRMTMWTAAGTPPLSKEWGIDPSLPTVVKDDVVDGGEDTA